MAQLWKLPCIYICENNQYGMGTSLKRAMSSHDISQKAVAYDIAAEFVDGMDVLAVRDATLRAVERARKDYLPTLLELRIIHDASFLQTGAEEFDRISLLVKFNFRARAVVPRI